MKFSPTPSQKEAIFSIDEDLAVTAGAGSGKTRVLAERYLNVLEQGYSFEEIAAVTFTKKAAQEMKERLSQTRPDLAGSLERAQISTIHSLCRRIIREHPREAGIDPRFKVGEEWETEALLQEVIEAEMQNRELIEGLGRPKEAAELILNLYQQIRTRGGFSFRGRETEHLVEQQDALQLAEAVDEFLALNPRTPLQKDVMEAWSHEWPLLQTSLFSGNPHLQLEALGILEDYLKKISGGLAQKTVLIKKGIEIIKEQIAERRGAEITRWCREVLEHVDRAYRRKKDSAGILDFNDLEHLAYVLLQDPQVGADYNFRHLLVDEFQDTNPLQKKIVDSLAGEKTRLFIVGDPKQSIYRFRGADVNVFLDTKEEIKARGKKVFLEENFRSRPEVVSFTNSFFQRLMGSGPISYQASNFRRPALGKPSVNILRTPALGLTLKEARSLEARQVALKIKSLVDQGDYNYEDISILFRVMTNVRFYEQALQELNIPYVNLSGRGFYSRREIQDVLHYFSWLEDPENEIARLAVLRSPFYLVSDQGLFWVRQNRPEKMGLADREALERSNNDYSVLKDLMVQKPAPEVISTMLELTGYVQKTWELPFGPQKTANVKKLVEQSWDLYTRDLVSVPEQLRYLRLAAESSEREGEAALDVEHADVVVLRTIHAAKGLEFPVVFLADTNGRLTRSGGERVLFHPDFGLTSKGQKDYELLKERNKEEELEEAKRLLYVAVTRAREELFWCGLEGPLQKNSWWNWLRTVLPELPADLYREIEGREEWPEAETAPALEEEASEPTSLKPLPPQYRQVSFSVTALLNYARCPRYYYFRYILGVPENFGEQPQSSPSGLETGLSALKRGNIVHRVCEQITAREDLGALIDYAAAMEGVRLNAGEKKQLKTMITPYLQSRFFRRVIGAEPGWQIYKEKEFTEILANFVINGMIDQVFVGAAGVEVLDFKSNWIQESQVAQEGRGYEVQLRLYAWAAARAFDLPVTKSQAYFLIPNKIYSLPAEQLAAAETEQWIIQTCTAIIAGADRGLEAFPPGPDCSRCGYQSFCGNSRGFGENTGETGQEVLS